MTEAQNGFNAETILLRSRRGEIVPVLVKLTGTRQIHTAWRDWQHSKLWDSLTPEQQGAWESILAGFNSLAGCMGARGFDPSSVRGKATGGDDYGAAIQADYRAWADMVRKSKIKFDLIINILVEGMSIREAARTAKPPTTPYFARRGLISALDLFRQKR